MNIVVSVRKATLKQNFNDIVEKRMVKFDKYFEDDAIATITVTAEGSRQTVEITVRYRGFIYRAERTEQDIELAFQNAADIIDRQITRNKSKLGSRIKKQDVTPTEGYTSYDDFADEEYRVVKEKQFALKPMSTKEAILQMNMLDHSFYVFMNIDTDTVCVVYHRKDDDYGLLLPQY